MLLLGAKIWCGGRGQSLDAPVVVTVHICLPVAHVDHHVPLEAGLAGLRVRSPLGALVVNVTGLRVTEMTLGRRTLEVGHGGGRLGDVEVTVPVSTGYGQEILECRRSEMRDMRADTG